MAALASKSLTLKIHQYGDVLNKRPKLSILVAQDAILVSHDSGLVRYTPKFTYDHVMCQMHLHICFHETPVICHGIPAGFHELEK